MKVYRVKTDRGIVSHDQLFKNKNKALSYAMEIRKFEIELCWKRAVYFFSLLAALFIAYGALINSDSSIDSCEILLLSVDVRESVDISDFCNEDKYAEKNIFLFIVTCLGIVVSAGWHCVNRGSKYWQSNWELHVEALENSVVGPLYKTTATVLDKKRFPSLSNEEMPYSPSKINMKISLFIMMAWMFLFSKHFISLISDEFKEYLNRLWKDFDFWNSNMHNFTAQDLVVIFVFAITIRFIYWIIRSTNKSKYVTDESIKFMME